MTVMKSLPNILTLSRIFVIPALIAAFYIDAPLGNWIAFALFTLASITDFFDGMIARAYGVTSKLGQFLDPVADKLMVAAALLVLLALGRVSDIVALIIIGREITISALREWMAQIGASKSVAVNMLGKLKTTFQMIAIPLLLFEGKLLDVIDAHVWGTWLIYVAAVLTLWSMAYYMKLAWPQIRERAK